MLKKLTDLKEKKQNDEIPEGYKKSEGYLIPKEWNLVQFKDLFNRLTRKNKENNQNVLTISARQGLISQMDYYNTLYASENKLGYSLLHKGDFSYNKSYSGDYAYGAIKRLEAYDKGIVSPLYICFEAKEGTNAEFYNQYFESGMFNREIYKIAQEGARNHGLLNVSTEDFFDSFLVFPLAKEQEKIADVLIRLDKIIALKKERIIEETRLKKWLTINLFDTLQHKYPEKEICKITDYIDYRGKTPKKATTGVFLVTAKNIKMGFIDYNVSKEYIPSEDYEFVMQRGKPQIGDVLITTEAPCGNVAQIDNEEVALAQRVILLRAKNGICNEYLCHYLQSGVFQKQLRIFQTGLTAQGIKGETLHKMKIPVPPLAKQVSICKVVSEQNNVIALLEEELEHYEEMKKSLMQLLLTGIVRVNI